MAETKEITVSYGYTHNMGNYESCRIDISMTKTVGPDDKAKEVADECFNGLRAWAMNKMREVVNASR